MTGAVAVPAPASGRPRRRWWRSGRTGPGRGVPALRRRRPAPQRSRPRPGRRPLGHRSARTATRRGVPSRRAPLGLEPPPRPTRAPSASGAQPWAVPEPATQPGHGTRNGPDGPSVKGKSSATGWLATPAGWSRWRPRSCPTAGSSPSPAAGTTRPGSGTSPLAPPSAVRVSPVSTFGRSGTASRPTPPAITESRAPTGIPSHHPSARRSARRGSGLGWSRRGSPRFVGGQFRHSRARRGRRCSP